MTFSAVSATRGMLARHHYLGPCRRGALAWIDSHGCMVFARPSARNIPATWLELTRWCLLDGCGSQQFSAFVAAWRSRPMCVATTLLSYSDPAQGHTGALYRACNWLWAPTWHRLRPPPSGNGAWSANEPQGVKDRWVFLLSPDPQRASILQIKDESVRRQMEWAEYQEPVWSKGRFRPMTGGGNFKKFTQTKALQ